MGRLVVLEVVVNGGVLMVPPRRRRGRVVAVEDVDSSGGTTENDRQVVDRAQNVTRERKGVVLAVGLFFDTSCNGHNIIVLLWNTICRVR